MPRPLIVAAACRVDGRGSLESVHGTIASLRRHDCRVATLEIDPLSTDWHAPLAPGRFRSGCAPVEALAAARDHLRHGAVDAVVIHGRDHLRTEYAADRALRTRRMAVYGERWPLPQAYTELAHAFCRHQGLDAGTFRSLAAALFENHRRVWEANGNRAAERPEWYAPVTELFRRVDCANPAVDFEGAAVLVNPTTADVCEVPRGQRVPLLGVAVEHTAGDGPQHVEEIARYRHLERAYHAACGEARVAFADRLRAGEGIMEAYTCFPVVPLAFLLASGIAAKPDDLAAAVTRYPVTVTGGMNLARAAWNNPALQGLAALRAQLVGGDAAVAALHGNGGLGEKQGVAILGRPGG